MSNRHPDDTTSRRLHVLHVSAPERVASPASRSATSATRSSAAGACRSPARRAASSGTTPATPAPGRTGGRRSVSRGAASSARRSGCRGSSRRPIRTSSTCTARRPDWSAGWPSATGVPTVFQPHAWSYLNATGGVRAASLRWERFATRWAALTVCVSDAERAAGARLGIGGRTVVIPNGVALSSFRPQGDRDRTGARKLLGLAEAPTAVCVGELHPAEGPARPAPRVAGGAAPGAGRSAGGHR